MRALILLCLCMLGPCLAAQPDLDRNYCGFAPNDSIDITNDGIPDLVIYGSRSGTDDEPSSSGTCSILVLNLPGTMLLNDKDDQGYWRIKACAVGDTILPMDTTRRDDLYIPPLSYGHAAIPVAWWGYGNSFTRMTLEPDLDTRHYVFRTEGKGGVRYGSFNIIPPMGSDPTRIRVDALVHADEPLIIR